MHQIQKINLGYTDLATIEDETLGRRYVTPEGLAYPSITTVLGRVGDKSFLEVWRKRVGHKEADRITRHAATRGSALHDSLEKFLLHEHVDTRKLMPHVQLSHRIVRSVLEKNLSALYLSEAPLYSDKHKIAGRVDAVGVYNGVESIIDFKTSRYVKTAQDISHYFQQAAAYSLMLAERSNVIAKQLVIIMAVDNSSQPLVFIESVENHVKDLMLSIKAYYEKYN